MIHPHNQFICFLPLYFSVLLLFQISEAAKAKQPQLNNRPIVGVLLQDVDNVSQIVAASYVKWAEMAGARVVPIFLKRDLSYYTKLFDQINGVLMPGGDAPLLNSGYSAAADLIIETTIAKYNQGIHWPIWATCLSLEKLITYFTGNQDLDWETHCDVWNVNMNLDFPRGISHTNVRMLQGAPHIFRLLKKYKVTPNFHHICLSVQTFRENQNLTHHFRLVSTNAHNGHHFVSTLEHKRWPIYTTQWHPEKNLFEWSLSSNMDSIGHDWAAVQVGQHFGNFFINEARKNGQKFTNATEEKEALIYNYSHMIKHPGNLNDEEVEQLYSFPL